MHGDVFRANLFFDQFVAVGSDVHHHVVEPVDRYFDCYGVLDCVDRLVLLFLCDIAAGLFYQPMDLVGVRLEAFNLQLEVGGFYDLLIPVGVCLWSVRRFFLRMLFGGACSAACLSFVLFIFCLGLTVTDSISGSG